MTMAYKCTCDAPGVSLPRFLDEVLGSAFGRTGKPSAGHTWPLVDIVEHDTEYLLSVDLPGVEKEDITVAVEGGTLTISGRREATPRPEGKERYACIERRSGEFSRSLELPQDCDPSAIEARCTNGVLELRVGKLAKAAPRSVRVKVE